VLLRGQEGTAGGDRRMTQDDTACINGRGKKLMAQKNLKDSEFFCKFLREVPKSPARE
jgi:hypothetical protein